MFAQYRPNQQCDLKSAPASWIIALTNAAWVPLNDGTFVKPAEASVDTLAKGVTIDPGVEWAKLISFGTEAIKRNAAYEQRMEFAKKLGFGDEQQLQDAQRFSQMSEADRAAFFAHFNAKNIEMPEHAPSNPERRDARVREAAAEAAEKTSRTVSRQVSEHREEVKEEARAYLEEQYTNPEGIMICQCCHTELPFKLGERYYVEKTAFFKSAKRWHRQNYLSLCPNHSAMFRHANETADIMIDLFNEMSDNWMEVVIGGRNETIYMTTTHVADIESMLMEDGGTAVSEAAE